VRALDLTPPLRHAREKQVPRLYPSGPRGARQHALPDLCFLSSVERRPEVNALRSTAPPGSTTIRS